MGKKRDDARKSRVAAGRKQQARVVLGGVRTRSVVTARAAAKRRKAVASAASAEEGGEGGCYLHLRSRRLYFMAASAAMSREPLSIPEAEARSPRAVELLGGYSWEEAMAGTGISSRSSASTASSVDARKRTPGGGVAGAAEVCDVVCNCTQAGDQDRGEESSVVGDSGCHRERNETTPSSRQPGDSSDAESSHAVEDQQERRHRARILTTSATAIHAPSRTTSIRMPPAAAEIEEFLAAAERAEAQRFAAMYNFDVVRGVPVAGGRFQWTPVGSG